MLLSERLLVSALCLGSVLCSSSTAAVTCPATVEVTESVTPSPPWNAGPAKHPRKFERISIYNGKAGEREFELAPDNQKQEGNKITQTWRLKAYRTTNIFLRCRYSGTSAVLYTNLPPEIETCTFRFLTDRKGAIIGQSEMVCR